jgi:uncharacterized membrane protein
LITPDSAGCVDTFAARDYDGERMKAFWRSVRISFFAGLVVVVPLAASLVILVGLFNWVTSFLLPKSLGVHEQTLLYRIIALVTFVLLVMLVGWLTRLVIGRRMVALGETIIARVPLLN